MKSYAAVLVTPDAKTWRYRVEVASIAGAHAELKLSLQSVGGVQRWPPKKRRH